MTMKKSYIILFVTIVELMTIQACQNKKKDHRYLKGQLIEIELGLKLRQTFNQFEKEVPIAEVELMIVQFEGYLLKKKVLTESSSAGYQKLFFDEGSNIEFDLPELAGEIPDYYYLSYPGIYQTYIKSYLNNMILLDKEYFSDEIKIVEGLVRPGEGTSYDDSIKAVIARLGKGDRHSKIMKNILVLLFATNKL